MGFERSVHLMSRWQQIVRWFCRILYIFIYMIYYECTWWDLEMCVCSGWSALWTDKTLKKSHVGWRSWGKGPDASGFRCWRPLNVVLQAMFNQFVHTFNLFRCDFVEMQLCTETLISALWNAMFRPPLVQFSSMSGYSGETSAAGPEPEKAQRLTDCRSSSRWGLSPLTGNTRQ